MAIHQANAVALIMCDATHTLSQLYRDKGGALSDKPLLTRAGSGLATYFRAEKTQNSIVFGKKMVQSKFEGVAGWLSHREIVRRDYFKGSTALDCLLAHTVCHEFAHLIQAHKHQRVRGSVHNTGFYNILDRLHTQGLAEQIRVYVVDKAQQQGLELKLDLSASTKTAKPSLSVGQIISFKHGNQWQQAKVIRVNTKTVSAAPPNQKAPLNYWRIPFSLIKA